MTTSLQGAFPYRAPLGVLAAVALSVLFLPAWFHLAVPELQRFYFWTYISSDLASVKNRNAPRRENYTLLFAGPDKPAVQSDLDQHREVLPVTVAIYPGPLHTWLKKWIYAGDFAKAFQRPVESAVLAVLLLLILGRLWDRRRQARAREGLHVRGTQLLSSVREFNRAALKGGLTPGISLTVGKRFGMWRERITIPRELEAYHFGICAATGAGKTTLILEICDQIEARGDVAVVYDPKGEARDRLYSQERGDVILDPTDDRCPYWALEEEARDEAEATPWGMAFYPDEPRQQPFFKKHPRAIFAYLISQFSSSREPDPKKVATCANLGYWLAYPRQMVSPLLKGTEHAVSTDASAKDQSQGLWSTLGEAAKPLRMMPAQPEGRQKFSVREWSQTRKGWIFMTSTPKTVDALLPLHSAVMDMLILENQEPSERKVPTVWFIIQEAATLQRLPQLESGMTKQRASGNPIILDFHDLAQLKKRYGDEGATTITSQAYTNVFLRAGSETDAKHAELMIGHQEVERVSENRPAHVLSRHNRSRSWSNQWVDRAVVMAAEIQKLRRFNGYVLFEGNVLKIHVQKLKQRIRTHRMERLIPPVVLREPPEPEVLSHRKPVPVDDLPVGVAVAQSETKPAENKQPLRRPKRFS